MSDLASWGLLSLRIAFIACLLATAFAVPMAYLSARRKAWWVRVIDTVFTVPMVLPPTVLGYLLMVAIGRHGPVGWLSNGGTLLYTEAAAVIAATIVALPLVYLPTKSAFSAIDRDLEDSARLWGAGGWTLFWQISIPMASKGIIAGLVLGFARALGEFGATVMVLGIQGQAGKQTLPIAIWVDWMDGSSPEAWPAVLLLLGISVLVVATYNRFMRI